MKPKFNTKALREFNKALQKAIVDLQKHEPKIYIGPDGSLKSTPNNQSGHK